MYHTTLFPMMAVLVVAWVAACGSGTDRNPAASDGSAGLVEALEPNLDPGRLVGTTSVSDQDILCDWVAHECGGYGHVLMCDADVAIGTGILVAPENRQACEREIGFAEWPTSCPLTVAQFASCIKWEAQNVCVVGMLTRAMLPVECQTFLGPQCAAGIGLADGGAD
jgi:hypothetical protein